MTPDPVHRHADVPGTRSADAEAGARDSAATAAFHKAIAGDILYGDDFEGDRLSQWYHEEREGYAHLIADHPKAHAYGFHALNIAYGFSKIPADFPLRTVLGIGCAYGQEFEPIVARTGSFVALEASKQLRRDQVGGKRLTYLPESPHGVIPLPDASVDLITCLGVLHHIANVSTVIKGMQRVLRPGGYLLIREPMVSMGDWSKPRHGLTKNERGIPLDYFSTTFAAYGLEVVSRRLCMMPFSSLLECMGMHPYNSRIMVAIDGFLSRLFAFNYRYHHESWYRKLRPMAVFFVVRRPSEPG